MKEEDEEEVDDPVETQVSKARSRKQNNPQEEYIALCHAWMNVSLDVSFGTDQSKEKSWIRIENYYCNTMSSHEAALKALLEIVGAPPKSKCNQRSGCVDLVNHALPSRV